jgi:hypothetical protein
MFLYLNTGICYVKVEEISTPVAVPKLIMWFGITGWATGYADFSADRCYGTVALEIELTIQYGTHFCAGCIHKDRLVPCLTEGLLGETV